MDGRVINEDGLNLELAVVPLSFTKPHEEVVEELVNRVVRSMLNEGKQIDPVVIDAESGTVLDGMHRRAAAKELGLDKLLVCKVDYSDPRILLKRWLRVSPYSTPLLEDLKVNLGLVKVSGMDEAINMVDRGHSTVSLLTPKGHYSLIQPPSDVFSAFGPVRGFDSLSRFHGLSVWPVRDAEAKDQAVRGNMVLYVPTPKKEEVVDSALSGFLFPPKYTRHIIPARPVGVGVPLEWLSRDVDLSTANERLESYLKGLEVKRLPPKSVYMGRIYDEVLYVFGGRE